MEINKENSKVSELLEDNNKERLQIDFSEIFKYNDLYRIQIFIGDLYIFSPSFEEESDIYSYKHFLINSLIKDYYLIEEKYNECIKYRNNESLVKYFNNIYKRGD